MKKHIDFWIIVGLYLLTVPTNVMCLGAFTEQWLEEFSISRQALTSIYGIVTLLVFISLNVFRWRCGICASLRWLSATCFVWVLGARVGIFQGWLCIVFFIFQYVGQGLMVAACRTWVLKISDGTVYGKRVGILEALGTMMVFIYPFFELEWLHYFCWNSLFLWLGFIYGLVAIFVKRYDHWQGTENTVKFRDLYDIRFIFSNMVIYLPVVLTSGLFFHLEFFCYRWGIDLAQLGRCAFPQVLGIILFQWIFGFCWKNKKWIAELYIVLLIISQVTFILSLVYFSRLGGGMYVLSGAVGWGLFGVLVNVIWKVLYGKHKEKVYHHLNASVNVGFLANAVGPALFYVLFISLK